MPDSTRGTWAAWASRFTCRLASKLSSPLSTTSKPLKNCSPNSASLMLPCKGSRDASAQAHTAFGAALGVIMMAQSTHRASVQDSKAYRPGTISLMVPCIVLEMHCLTPQVHSAVCCTAGGDCFCVA